MWLLSKLNKDINVKIWVLLVLVIASIFATNRLTNNDNGITELTKVQQEKVDSLVNINNENLVLHKKQLDSTIQYYKVVTEKLQKESETDKSKIITVYKDGKIIQKTELVDVVKRKEKEIKIVDETVIKQYNEQISTLEKQKNNLEINFAKYKKDSTNIKIDKFSRNNLIVGNYIEGNSELNFNNNTYIEYKRNISKSFSTNIGLEHNTVSQKTINSLSEVNNYTVYVGIAYTLNF